MKVISELLKQLVPHKSIFELRLDNPNGIYRYDNRPNKFLNASLSQEAKVDSVVKVVATEEYHKPLEHIINSNAVMNYRNGIYMFDIGHIKQTVINNMLAEIRKFIYKESKIKNAINSDLMKFFENSFLSTEKYVIKYNIESMYLYLMANYDDIRNKKNSVHRSNMLALLRKIKEKHGASPST